MGDTEEVEASYSSNSLCYLIVCFRRVDYVSFLIASLYREQDIFIVHCDKKGSDELKAYLSEVKEKWHNIKVLQSTDYSWAGYSHVDLVIRSMELALSLSCEWSHFITLSEQHLPLKSPDEIARFLTPGRSLMQTQCASDLMDGMRADIEHRCACTYRELPGVGCFATAIRERDPSFFHHIYHGSNWNIFARNHCQYVLDEERKGGFVDFQTMVHAEEIALQSVIAPLKGEFDQSESTVVAQPHLVDNTSLIMTDDLFRSSLQSQALFIRKRQSLLSDYVKGVITNNHYIPTLDIDPNHTLQTAMRPENNAESDLTSSIIDAARSFFSKNGRDEVNIQKIEPSEVSSRLYLVFSFPRSRAGFDVRLLSENLTDFKACIIRRTRFGGWSARREGNFIVTPGRSRIYDVFSAEDIIPDNVKDGGFVTISSIDEIERVLEVVADMLGELKAYKQHLHLNGDYSMMDSRDLLVDISGVWYTEFLRDLCKKKNVKNYFEIGVNAGESMSFIECETAVGVDPNFIIKHNVANGKRQLHLFHESSDRFFADRDLGEIMRGPVDVAFLDGMHLFEFLLRDFRNLERFCTPQTIVFLHDCMPLNHEMTTRDMHAPRTDEAPYNAMWTGDVWKLVPILKKYRPGLKINLLDCGPTGLVAITNLEPTSKILFERYLEIVEDFRRSDHDFENLLSMYHDNNIISAQKIINGFDWSLYFNA